MKQKIIISFSVILLLLAVYLITRDLFRRSPSYSNQAYSGDETYILKKIDTTLLGYQRSGFFETGLDNLRGIAVNEKLQVFVCGDRHVVVYDSQGNKTSEFRIDSTANCIALNNNMIYLGMGCRVVCYHAEGNLKSVWKPYNNQGYITSIAATNEFIYAADAMNKRILKYTTDGDLVLDFGKKDSQAGTPGFVIPSLYFDIAPGGFNDLWIVNPGLLQVENYTLSGTMRTSWGSETLDNNGFTGCCNPAHMALLPDGSFVTYEKGTDKIKVFDPMGRFSCMVAGSGSFKGRSDFQQGRNNLVKDLATDIHGTIYVLDAYNRVNVFVKTDEPSAGL
jgi:hypothetical protein